MPAGPERISGSDDFRPCDFSASHSCAAASGVPTETTLGSWLRTCFATSATWEPAARAMTSNDRGCASTTSSVWRPIEPVEPRIEMRFICVYWARTILQGFGGFADADESQSG